MNMNANRHQRQILRFCPLSAYPPGTIYALLCESYAPLLQDIPKYANTLKQNWCETDRFAYAHANTPIGACFFLTCLGNTPIGMGSIDPRNRPRIGQNCLLPAYRGRGFGAQQLQEMLRGLKQRKAKTIIAITSDHPFFLPAQRMYLSAGFRETRRFPGDFSPCIQFEYRIKEQVS